MCERKVSMPGEIRTEKGVAGEGWETSELPDRNGFFVITRTWPTNVICWQLVFSAVTERWSEWPIDSKTNSNTCELVFGFQ